MLTYLVLQCIQVHTQVHSTCCDRARGHGVRTGRCQAMGDCTRQLVSIVPLLHDHIVKSDISLGNVVTTVLVSVFDSFLEEGIAQVECGRSRILRRALHPACAISSLQRAPVFASASNEVTKQLRKHCPRARAFLRRHEVFVVTESQ
jgi:hypothetical protein